MIASNLCIAEYETLQLQLLPLDANRPDVSDACVARLSLDRASAANSVSRQMLSDLESAFRFIESSPAIRVLLVDGGSCKHFCGQSHSLMQPD